MAEMRDKPCTICELKPCLSDECKTRFCPCRQCEVCFKPCFLATLDANFSPWKAMGSDE